MFNSSLPSVVTFSQAQALESARHLNGKGGGQTAGPGAAKAPFQTTANETLAAQNQKQSANSNTGQDQQDDSLSFSDLLDVINPLQHIPVVNKIYRQITGDEIREEAKIAGATLFGGAVGLVASSVNAAVTKYTDQDIGDHVLDMVGLDEWTESHRALQNRPESGKPVQLASTANNTSGSFDNTGSAVNSGFFGQTGRGLEQGMGQGLEQAIVSANRGDLTEYPRHAQNETHQAQTFGLQQAGNQLQANLLKLSTNNAFSRAAITDSVHTNAVNPSHRVFQFQPATEHSTASVVTPKVTPTITPTVIPSATPTQTKPDTLKAATVAGQLNTSTQQLQELLTTSESGANNQQAILMLQEALAKAHIQPQEYQQQTTLEKPAQPLQPNFRMDNHSSMKSADEIAMETLLASGEAIVLQMDNLSDSSEFNDN